MTYDRHAHRRMQAPRDFRALVDAGADAADAALERDIAAATRAIGQAKSPEAARAALAVLRSLHRRRSPAQVERLERALGLRP